MRSRACVRRFRSGSLTLAALETLERRFVEIDESGPRTGLIDLDAMLGPFRPGTINVVGSRPSAGRTTLVLGAALWSARDSRSRVVRLVGVATP